MHNPLIVKEFPLHSLDRAYYLGMLSECDGPGLAAQQTLLDQRLFMVSGTQYQAFLDLLDQPEQPNPGLQELFSRKAPWEK
jgi:hypothetical protein